MKRIIALLAISLFIACQCPKESNPVPAPTKEIKLKAWHIPDSLRYQLKPY